MPLSSLLSFIAIVLSLSLSLSILISNFTLLILQSWLATHSFDLINNNNHETWVFLSWGEMGFLGWGEVLLWFFVEFGLDFCWFWFDILLIMGQFCVWIIRSCNLSCGVNSIWVLLGLMVVVVVVVGSLLLLHDKKVWWESMTREWRWDKKKE